MMLDALRLSVDLQCEYVTPFLATKINFSMDT